jgi:hypothetical protein
MPFMARPPCSNFTAIAEHADLQFVDIALGGARRAVDPRLT